MNSEYKLYCPQVSPNVGILRWYSKLRLDHFFILEIKKFACNFQCTCQWSLFSNQRHSLSLSKFRTRFQVQFVLSRNENLTWVSTQPGKVREFENGQGNLEWSKEFVGSILFFKKIFAIWMKCANFNVFTQYQSKSRTNVVVF